MSNGTSENISTTSKKYYETGFILKGRKTELVRHWMERCFSTAAAAAAAEIADKQLQHLRPQSTSSQLRTGCDVETVI